MKRLPVYLLLDTSSSMQGEPMDALKKGIQTMASTLRMDPFILETLFLSIITFDSFATQIVPLIELPAFRVPDMNASGATALGDALGLLSSKVALEVQKTTFFKKGDWRPLVFIMTDGAPTDNWKRGLFEFKKHKFGMVIACAAGRRADVEALKEITPTVLVLNVVDTVSVNAFFQWVAASIINNGRKIVSERLEMNSIGELPPMPREIDLAV